MSLWQLLWGFIAGWFTGISIFVWIANKNPSIMSLFMRSEESKDIVKNWFGKE